MKKLLILLVIFILIVLVIFLPKKKTFSINYPAAVATPSPQKESSPTIINKSSYSISSGPSPNVPIIAPSNYVIHIFANGFENPRVLVFSPGGTLLVSDPGSGEVVALPDVNHKGVAETKKVIISGGNNIHGLAFYGGKLIVAEVDKVSRYSWDEGNLTAKFEKILFTLPENGDHNKRTITFDSTGKMYVSVGSTCDVCIEQSNLSGTVLISDLEGNSPHIFASGLRNAAFLAINPKTNELWGTEMGRDYLGDDLPPDEINIIRKSGNYGWPYCYGNKIHDTNFEPFLSYTCENTIPPIYEIPAHSAPLGLVFIKSPQFPSDWQGDLLVAYHGSWNRTSPIGYKVVHLKVNENAISNSSDFLTGFINGDSYSSVLGRPVDLIFDSLGNLYLSDDKAGNIYIIQKKIN